MSLYLLSCFMELRKILIALPHRMSFYFLSCWMELEFSPCVYAFRIGPISRGHTFSDGCATKHPYATLRGSGIMYLIWRRNTKYVKQYKWQSAALWYLSLNLALNFVLFTTRGKWDNDVRVGVDVGHIVRLGWWSFKMWKVVVVRDLPRRYASRLLEGTCVLPSILAVKEGN